MLLDAPALVLGEGVIEIVREDHDHLVTRQTRLAHTPPVPVLRYSSSARRTRARARCRSTRWFVSERSSALHTSSEFHPRTSRSRITSACIGGSASIARPIRRSVSLPRSLSSGMPCQSPGKLFHPPGARPPASWNHAGSTPALVSSSPASEENGTLRPSAAPLVLAMFATIRLDPRAERRAALE